MLVFSTLCVSPVFSDTLNDEIDQKYLFNFIVNSVDKEEVLGPRLGIRDYGGMNPRIGSRQMYSNNPFLEILNDTTSNSLDYSMGDRTSEITASGVVSRADLASGNLAPVIETSTAGVVRVRVPVTRIGNPTSNNEELAYPLSINYFEKRKEYFFTNYDEAIASMKLDQTEIIYHTPKSLRVIGMFDNELKGKESNGKVYFASNDKVGAFKKLYMMIPIEDEFTRTAHKTFKEKLALKFLYIPLPDDGLNHFKSAREATYSGVRNYSRIEELKYSIKNHLLNNEENSRFVLEKVNEINSNRFNMAQGPIYRDDTYLNDSARELKSMKKELNDLLKPITYRERIWKDGFRLKGSTLEHLTSLGDGPRVIATYHLETDSIKLRQSLVEDGFITNSKWKVLFGETRETIASALINISNYKQYQSLVGYEADGRRDVYKNSNNFSNYMMRSVKNTNSQFDMSSPSCSDLINRAVGN